jgi:DNA-binding GntR family transcriptional regulator
MDTGVDTGLSTALHPDSGSRRAEVYGQLRRAVLVGEFAVNSRLVEEKLASRLGVSRTPVREALVRLCADRLLRKGADGGYYVAQPDLTDLSHLYELRITLELRGVVRPLETEIPHQAAVLEPIRDQWRELRSDPPAPDSRFVEVDESFHLGLCTASGNNVLLETLELVNARIRPVRMYDFLTSDRIEQTIVEHLRILELVLAGQLPDAAREVRCHIGESMAVVERRAAEAITQMALGGGRRP